MKRKQKHITKLVIMLLAVLLLVETHPRAYTRALDNAHGLDLAGMDKTVKPGDDFFGYANGNWMKSTSIPNDRSSYGVFDMLAEEASKRTADLITGASKSATNAE